MHASVFMDIQSYYSVADAVSMCVLLFGQYTSVSYCYLTAVLSLGH